MHKAIVAVALLAAAGCKKDSKSSGASGSAATGSASASTADCKAAVAGAFQRAARAGMEAGASEDGKKPIDDNAKAAMDSVEKDLEARFVPLSDAISGACISDHWSPEMLACVQKAKTGDDIDACNKFLDDAQKKHLDAVTAAAEAKTNPAATASPTCAKYADLEIKCNAAGEDARPTILDFCAKARAGDKQAVYQLIALESTCADTATDCDAYKACVEKKKSETTPTP